MATIRTSRRFLGLMGVVAALFAAFIAAVRPWYLNWGSTAEEQIKTLPGDEIVADARQQQTRAITITAPINQVWPWLAQLGQDRGGFYSFDVLENIVGCEVPVNDILLPDKQTWQLGDKLWMYPKEKAGGAGFATLQAFVPGRALGFATRATGTSLSEPEDGSWSMVLEPASASTTRLLIRGRGTSGRSLLGVTFDRSVFEPIHFAMERRMMIGIKQLVETGNRGRLSNHVNVALWTITFVVFVVAGVFVMRAKTWKRALVGFAAAGVVFQVLTLAQPPAPVGLTLVWFVFALLWWPSRYADAAGESDAQTWSADESSERDADDEYEYAKRPAARSRLSGV